MHSTSLVQWREIHFPEQFNNFTVFFRYFDVCFVQLRFPLKLFFSVFAEHDADVFWSPWSLDLCTLIDSTNTEMGSEYRFVNPKLLCGTLTNRKIVLG